VDCVCVCVDWGQGRERGGEIGWGTSSSTDKKKTAPFFFNFSSLLITENSRCVKLNCDGISQDEDERAGIEENIMCQELGQPLLYTLLTHTHTHTHTDCRN